MNEKIYEMFYVLYYLLLGLFILSAFIVSVNAQEINNTTVIINNTYIYNSTYVTIENYTHFIVSTANTTINNSYYYNQTINQTLNITNINETNIYNITNVTEIINYTYYDSRMDLLEKKMLNITLNLTNLTSNINDSSIEEWTTKDSMYTLGIILAICLGAIALIMSRL